MMRYQRKRKAENLDDFNESHRKAEAKHAAKKKMDDLEGFLEPRRRKEANRKSRRMEQDKEGFNKKNREDVAKCRGNMREENPDKLKEDQNKWKAKERSNAENSYLNEVRLAAIFPCVCCHTLNFRQQVVEFSQKQADSIKEKAFAVFQKQKVQINIS